MKINRVGVDLAKNIFQLHGADHKGKTVWKRRLPRGKWLAVLCDTVEPETEIGMEACDPHKPTLKRPVIEWLYIYS